MTVDVPPGTLAGLRSLAQSAAVPLKTVLLAAHLRVVSLLTGRNDVTTGLITNGRPEEQTSDRIVGLFLNTIPLRLNPGGGSWKTLLKDTFKAERSALPHRRYPLSELIRTIGDGQPLFETGFNYIHFHIYQALKEVPNLSVLGWESPSDQTYFPLTAYFHLDISTSNLFFFLDVDTGILAQRQINRLRHYYLNTLNYMAFNQEENYDKINLLPEQEFREVTEEWNRTGDEEAEKNPFVFRRFVAAANKNGKKEAVICNDQSITYADLDKRSDHLASYLRLLGVGPGVLVGVCLERSINLVVSLLGVLKAGGAYGPLDPTYPYERTAFMLNDAEVKVLVTGAALSGGLPAGSYDMVCIDSDWEKIENESAEVAAGDISVMDLAYVIYTSGSTGQPKGVEINHRALANFITAMEGLLEWSSGERLLAVTTICFDIAGLEIFLPLTTGATIVLAANEVVMDGRRLAKVLNEEKITAMQATPATWRMLINTGWLGTRGLKAFCGGEELSRYLANELLKRDCTLRNLYGAFFDVYNFR